MKGHLFLLKNIPYMYNSAKTMKSSGYLILFRNQGHSKFLKGIKIIQKWRI